MPRRKRRRVHHPRLPTTPTVILTPRQQHVDHTFAAAPDRETLVAATCPEDTQVVGGYVKPGFSAFGNFAESYVDVEQNAFMIRLGPGSPSEPGEATIQTICLR